MDCADEANGMPQATSSTGRAARAKIENMCEAFPVDDERGPLPAGFMRVSARRASTRQSATDPTSGRYPGWRQHRPAFPHIRAVAFNVCRSRIFQVTKNVD
jgi:hypothetical protein